MSHSLDRATQEAVTRPRGPRDELELSRGHGHPLGSPPGADRLLAKLERDVLGLPSEALIAGRFTLLEQIGAGGLGVVYAAYDTELDRWAMMPDLVGLFASQRPHT